MRPPGAPYASSDLCPGNGWLGWSGFRWSGDQSRKVLLEQPHNGDAGRAKLPVNTILKTSQYIAICDSLITLKFSFEIHFMTYRYLFLSIAYCIQYQHYIITLSKYKTYFLLVNLIRYFCYLYYKKCKIVLFTVS